MTALEGNFRRRNCDYLRSFDVPHLWTSFSRLLEPATWIRERTFAAGRGPPPPFPLTGEAASGAVDGNQAPKLVRRSTFSSALASPGHVPRLHPFMNQKAAAPLDYT
jgi:hypothetical protein